MSRQQHGRLTIFQAAAVDDRRLGNAAFRVLAALGTYSDKDGWCYPTQTTIATRLGITRQAVNKSLQQLAELGYIAIKAQYGDDGGKRANLYRLNLDRVTEPMQPDVAPMQPDVVTHATSEVASHATNHVASHATNHVAYNVPPERPNENDPKGAVRALPRLTLETYCPDVSLLEGLGAERPDLNLPGVIDNWRDYHRERGTAIKDFNASLRRWVRNEKPQARGSPKGQNDGWFGVLNRVIEQERQHGPEDFPDALDAAFVVGETHRQQRTRGA